MASKRKRRGSPVPKGLAAGEQLKRSLLIGNDSSAWGWVGTEVLDRSEITQEHRMITCGLSKRSRHPFCPNKYAPVYKQRASPRNDIAKDGELDDDVIVISDDELPPCSKKLCRNNPNCLNYLGQEKWEDEDKARQAFLKLIKLGDDPVLDARDPDIPVGLKNLGATCYANAFLQVWFQDLAFRNGVYQCQPPQNSNYKFEDSPVFQLQVTFAALQESTQNVFNPTKLVESLKLRTTEQQDAQEFSKLFMSHLDAEFKKQSISSLRTLIADQFEGKQVYGTICDNCQNRSERTSDFLEIEINFENNAKLEDRIAALLQPEKLSGDNQYLCARCDSLQDATRYTELRELPPVLHFSLLRFVYDISSMERKKSKNAILFPTTLNMDHFIGSAAARKTAASDASVGENMYELKGVLLHKGASAYHGHYEAQVFDATNKAWFQFDDETVTKIKTLSDKRSAVKAVVDIEDEDDMGIEYSKPKPKNARKKMRVDSDDEDIVEIPSPTSSSVNEPQVISREISSKDAYMLVYTRKGSSIKCNGAVTHKSKANGQPRKQPAPEIPTPPPRVMDVINSLNATHDEACEMHAKKEKEARLRFADLRRKVMNVYQSWSVNNSSEDSVIVSQQALEAWMSRHLVKPTQDKSTDMPSSPRDTFPTPQSVELSDILCPHDHLDPVKAGSMKRISQMAYYNIVETAFTFFPLLPDQVCKECVEENFAERLYQIEHPQIVAQFDEVNRLEEGSEGYWISKQWLKDWRSAKPKMHTPSEADPAPDADDYDGHVKCEHSKLALNMTSRRRISIQAYFILRKLFPLWHTLPTDEEPCAICDALVHISKGDKREIRKKAEDEKAKLKHMHDNALTGGALDLENVPCAVVPAQFVRSWRQWLSRPADAVRPGMIDNKLFICEHGMLLFDPNSPGDLNTSITVIKRSDWDVLEGLYPGGPLIALEKRLIEDDLFETKYVHDIPTCADCRHKRKLNYETTEITVRILRAQDPNPTPATYLQLGETSVQRIVENGRKPSASTYGRQSGTRQSTRIRQVQDRGGKRKLTISKQSTVKDIKIQLYDELSIPTVYQRLFYQGQELEDNTVTASSLGILADDVLHLREETEDGGNTTDDTIPAKKKGREEGRGFGGTLLGGGSSQPGSSPPGSLSPVEATQMEVDHPPLSSKSCSACTFMNTPDASTCEMCDTSFS